MGGDGGHGRGWQGKPHADDFVGTPSAILPVPEVAKGVKRGYDTVMGKLQELISGPTGAEAAPPPKPGPTYQQSIKHGDNERPPENPSPTYNAPPPYQPQ